MLNRQPRLYVLGYIGQDVYGFNATKGLCIQFLLGHIQCDKNGWNVLQRYVIQIETVPLGNWPGQLILLDIQGDRYVPCVSRTDIDSCSEGPRYSFWVTSNVTRLTGMFFVVTSDTLTTRSHVLFKLGHIPRNRHVPSVPRRHFIQSRFPLGIHALWPVCSLVPWCSQARQFLLGHI